jgi:hypothetical protein
MPTADNDVSTHRTRSNERPTPDLPPLPVNLWGVSAPTPEETR